MKCGPGCEGGSGGFLGNRGEWEMGGGVVFLRLEGARRAGGGGVGPGRARLVSAACRMGMYGRVTS